MRPETDQAEHGSDGAARFWQQYLGQFEQIHSQFSRVVDGPVAVLEWTSSGRTRQGSEISYRGVSLLDVGGDGRISRFATYYDTAPFAVNPAA